MDPIQPLDNMQDDFVVQLVPLLTSLTDSFLPPMSSPFPDPLHQPMGLPLL